MMRSGDTPVPIPNTTVKIWAVDGTGWEAAWESRWSPESNMPMWLNWQSSWLVISRLSVRVRSSALYNLILNCIMGRFPSGQRGQTVNLLQIASVVRIHLHPLFIDVNWYLRRWMVCGYGGIGRHKGLKIPRSLRPYRFKSGHRHQKTAMRAVFFVSVIF